VGVPSDVPDDDISMAMLQEHPNAFMRDYRMNAFEKGTLKYLHSGLWSYEFIRCIDISGLAVGDEGFSELCAGIGGRCPVETLVLTGNNITDRGLEVFSGVCRSLSKLHHLILNDNKFGDRGVAALFHPHRYPSALRLVNLSKNRLQVKSAYFIGLMFLKERSAAVSCCTYGYNFSSNFLYLSLHLFFNINLN
jgi:Ran GTPase-activating protein (RanGAP) involved in mRNA processing and transport